MKRAIVEFWSKLFNMRGNARMGIEKMKIGNGMEVGLEEVSKYEIRGAIKKLKMNKAMDESGMIAEYLKALNETSMERLRELLNGVIQGNSTK